MNHLRFSVLAAAMLMMTASAGAQGYVKSDNSTFASGSALAMAGPPPDEDNFDSDPGTSISNVSIFASKTDQYSSANFNGMTTALVLPNSANSTSSFIAQAISFPGFAAVTGAVSSTGTGTFTVTAPAPAAGSVLVAHGHFTINASQLMGRSTAAVTGPGVLASVLSDGSGGTLLTVTGVTDVLTGSVTSITLPGAEGFAAPWSVVVSPGEQLVLRASSGSGVPGLATVMNEQVYQGGGAATADYYIDGVMTVASSSLPPIVGGGGGGGSGGGSGGGGGGGGGPGAGDYGGGSGY